MDKKIESWILVLKFRQKMESQRSAVFRVEESKEVDKILDEIPTENVVNPHIDSIKKRRSSLRRSVNGGFSSTLRGNDFLEYLQPIL